MSKIKEVLNDKNSVLVFDVDGVLAIMEWGEYNHYGETDEDWTNMYTEGTYLYTEKYVSKRMQDFLKDKDMSRIYVITKVFTEHELEDKKVFLEKYYNIKKENVFSVKNNSEKVDLLLKIKEEYPDIDNHNLVMIDDTVEVLTGVMVRTKFSTAHISSFLDWKIAKKVLEAIFSGLDEGHEDPRQ